MTRDTAIDATAEAAAPVGASATAPAWFIDREGNVFVSEVSARDAAGEVGRGAHRRAVVSAGRLPAGAPKRAADG